MTGALRLRLVTVLAAFGVLAGAASYVFGAPVSVGLLVPAMALVVVVTLSLGVRAAAVTAVLGGAGFLYVQLAGVRQPLVVDFGPGSSSFDLPTLLHGAGGTWLPTLLGLAMLLLMVPVAALLRRDLTARSAESTDQRLLSAGAAAGQAPPDSVVHAAHGDSPTAPLDLTGDSRWPDRDVLAGTALPLAVLRAAHEAGFRPVSENGASGDPNTGRLADNPDGAATDGNWSPQVAAFVTVSLSADSDGNHVPDANDKRLVDVVGAELGGWRETAVVTSDDRGDVLMLLPGEDDGCVYALVHRLEDRARREFQRTLLSVVLGPGAPDQAARELWRSGAEMRLEGRPVGAPVSSRER